MYDTLRTTQPQGNLFFSGTSVRQALGVAYLGARNQTASEMSKAVRLDADLNKSAVSAKSEIGDWKNAKGEASLAIANRLWADKTFKMLPDFTARATTGYGTSTEPVDFGAHPNAARITINNWVADQTNQKIKDLLPAPAISSDTRLVITNAIWFKGSWAHAFKKSMTQDQAFMVDGKTSTSVPMMNQSESFGYVARDNVKILEMKYEKSDLVMDVILPDATNGIGALEDQLAKGAFSEWMKNPLPQRKVDVSLPKTSFTWGGSMKPALRTMGMSKAFDEAAADFSGLASRKDERGNLYISDVIHKAFVAIDEQGTEAAASTAVIIARETSVESKHEVFKADHPFVFMIRDAKRNRVLFMGRVTNPKG